MEEKKIACTVRVPESVARQLKSKSALEGKSIQDVLLEAVYAYVQDEKHKAK